MVGVSSSYASTGKVSSGTIIGKVRQYYASITVTIGIFGLGCVLGWTSPALPNIEMTKDLGNITSSQKAWIGSTSMLGALISAPVGGISVEKFGRKNAMMIFALPFITGWALMGMSTSINLLLIGRFITGFSGGIFSLAAPIFISETSEDKIRGLLSSFFQLMMVLGILFVYVVGSYVSWQTLAYICCIFPGLFPPLAAFIPESPRLLLAKGRVTDAAKSLAWYRGKNWDDEEIQEELTQVQMSVEESKKLKIGLKEAFSPSIIKPVLISLSLMVFEQVSGFNAVIFYTVDIFQAAGSSLDSNLSTIIVGIIQVAATVVSSLLVDRAGRRVLLIFSEVVMAISLFALGTYFYYKEKLNDGVSPAGFGWLPITSLIVFIVAFAQGIGPLSWTLMGEILPPNLKGACCSIATSLVWFSAFLVTFSYEPLLHLLGIYWCFWIFCIFCILGTVVITAFVPETKGYSLEEISALFSSKPGKGSSGTQPSTSSFNNSQNDLLETEKV